MRGSHRLASKRGTWPCSLEVVGQEFLVWNLLPIRIGNGAPAPKAGASGAILISGFCEKLTGLW